MKNRGRPKMQIFEHLGLRDKITPQEVEELFRQAYEKLGPTYCVELLSRFHTDRLSKLLIADYPRFTRILKEHLGL